MIEVKLGSSYPKAGSKLYSNHIKALRDICLRKWAFSITLRLNIQLPGKTRISGDHFKSITKLGNPTGGAHKFKIQVICE